MWWFHGPQDGGPEHHERKTIMQSLCRAKRYAAVLGALLLVCSVSFAATTEDKDHRDERLKVLQVQTDFVAKTVTIDVANLDSINHLASPKVRLAGSPLALLNSSVNNPALPTDLTPDLPPPVPTDTLSFLYRV